MANTPPTALTSSDRTIYARVNAQKIGSWMHIVEFGTTALYGRCYLRIFVNGLMLFGNEIADATPNPNTSLSANTNYDCCVTVQGTVVKYYLNSVLDGTASLATLNTQLGNLVVGAKLDGSLPFNGNLSNVLIYNRILTQDEITLLYSLGK
jgi:hypothetical protein